MLFMKWASQILGEEVSDVFSSRHLVETDIFGFETVLYPEICDGEVAGAA